VIEDAAPLYNYRMSLRKTLEDIVFENGLTDILRLERARQEAETRDVPLATTLIDLGFVEQRSLAALVSRVMDLPLIDPLPDEEATRLRDRLPSALARDAMAVPVALNGTRLTVALIDPTRADLIEALERESGLTIEPAVAIRGSLEALIDRIYPAIHDDAAAEALSLLIDRDKDAALRRAESEATAGQGPDDDGMVATTTTKGGDESTAPRGSRAIRPLEIRVDRIEERIVDIVRILADVQTRLDAIEDRLRRLPNS